jgi:hypothetical protein
LFLAPTPVFVWFCNAKHHSLKLFTFKGDDTSTKILRWQNIAKQKQVWGPRLGYRLAGLRFQQTEYSLRNRELAKEKTLVY